MQIRVDKFRTNLSLLQPLVPRKPTLPVIANVLVKDGRMTATDLETTVSLNLPEVQGAAFLLPYRSVMELLKYVPGDEMLNIDSSDNYQKKLVKLSWSSGSASYEVKDVQDYPEVTRTPEFQAEGHLSGDVLIGALVAALPYCATETARPVLSGVTVYLGPVLQIAGADGFRLSYQSLKLAYPVQQTLILPANTIQVLAHLWQKAPAAVPLGSSLVRQLIAARQLKLALADGIADFQFGNIQLTAKPIAGTAPDHLALLNNFHEPVKVKLMAPELRNAVRRVEGIARDGTGIVRLKWTETVMTISAKHEETGESSADIPVLPESIPGRVGLNVKYLRDYLEGKEGLITLGKDEGSSPALFHYGSQPIVAIMPMNVQWDDEQPAEPGNPEQAEATPGTEEPPADDRESEAGAVAPDQEPEPETAQETAGEPEAVGVAAGKVLAENSQKPEEIKVPEKRSRRRKKK